MDWENVYRLNMARRFRSIGGAAAFCYLLAGSSFRFLPATMASKGLPQLPGYSFPDPNVRPSRPPRPPRRTRRRAVTPPSWILLRRRLPWGVRWPGLLVYVLLFIHNHWSQRHQFLRRAYFCGRWASSRSRVRIWLSFACVLRTSSPSSCAQRSGELGATGKNAARWGRAHREVLVGEVLLGAQRDQGLVAGLHLGQRLVRRLAAHQQVRGEKVQVVRVVAVWDLQATLSAGGRGGRVGGWVRVTSMVQRVRTMREDMERSPAPLR